MEPFERKNRVMSPSISVQDVIDVLFLELANSNVPEPIRGFCLGMTVKGGSDYRYYWGKSERPIVFIEQSTVPEDGLIFVSKYGRTDSPRVAADAIIKRLYLAILAGADDLPQRDSEGYYLFRRALIIAGRQRHDAKLRKETIQSELLNPLSTDLAPLDQRSLDRLYRPWTMLNWVDQGRDTKSDTTTAPKSSKSGG